ncbi:hypothetical protein Tco_1095298 [Tanacetum coccineum]
MPRSNARDILLVVEHHPTHQDCERNMLREDGTGLLSFGIQNSTVGEHIMPDGMGTYKISHILHINQTQKVSKPEGSVISAAQSSNSNNNDENLNYISYTSSGPIIKYFVEVLFSLPICIKILKNMCKLQLPDLR